MAHSKITMRELVLQFDKYWDSMIGEELGEDIVYEKSIEEIPLILLLHEGACLKIAIKDLKAYIGERCANLYDKDGWKIRRYRRAYIVLKN